MTKDFKPQLLRVKSRLLELEKCIIKNTVNKFKL